MLNAVLLGLALLALLSIIFEEVTHLNKAKTTLYLGCLAWILLFAYAGDGAPREQVNRQFSENLLEIASLWLFLMSTMTFVAYLNARGMVRSLVQRLFPQVVSQRGLMLRLSLFALVLSSICDNVTATLVTLGVVHAFDMDDKTRIRMAVLVVFAVNSGGVALITGDVTTLMIFLSGNVTMLQLLTLFLPAACGVVLLWLMLGATMRGQVAIVPAEHGFTTVDVVIACTFFATIVATMVFNILWQVPPVLTFLTGLSVMFLVGRKIHSETDQIRILEYVRQVEYDTLLFFLGILLLVGMLKEIGALEQVANFYSSLAPMYANYVAGAVSALIDNVPLTAALLKAAPELDASEWLGLTYAVGVGGSLLVIGSAAGIVAMSKVRGLSFSAHLRYAPALLLAYSLGYGVTLVVGRSVFG